MFKRKKRLFHKGIDLFNDVQHIKDSLATITNHIKKKTSAKLSDSFDHAKEKAAHLEDDVDTYLSDRPYKSIGAALVVGVLLGFLLHHRDD